MPGDDLYKKLSEPSPDSFPKFEEESWKKMELLLDKHLPENNGRTFPYILLLGCIILASLTTFLPAKRTTQVVDGSMSTANSFTVKTPRADEKTELQSPPVADKTNTTLNKNEDMRIQVQTSQNKHHSTGTESVTAENHVIKEHKSALSLVVKSVPVEKEFIIHNTPSVEEIALQPTGRAFSLTGNNHFPLRNNVPADNRLLISTNEMKPTVSRRNRNGFSLTFSTGLETPGTGFSTWGRLTPLVGIGLMYSVGEKIIVRTGVASATKIYSALDKDYNPVNNYWASYTYFNKIDADCKIIEIPLGVAYRVVGSKKTNLYVSAGASSIIMRKEAYGYYYKNQAGRDTVTHRAWNNNSFHLFSNINFSAIAERTFSDRFSLMAEPGIKIPSGGVGVGKIRLYNAGLTVTAKFKLSR